MATQEYVFEAPPKVERLTTKSIFKDSPNECEDSEEEEHVDFITDEGGTQPITFSDYISWRNQTTEDRHLDRWGVKLMECDVCTPSWKKPSVGHEVDFGVTGSSMLGD